MPNNNRPRRKPSKKGPNKHKNTNSAPRKVEAWSVGKFTP